MNKFFSLACALLASVAASAQTAKTSVQFQESQARMRDVVANAVVKPLTCEVELISGKVRKTYPIDAAKVNSFKGSAAELRKWAAFELSKETDADVIVAPTCGVPFDSSVGKGTVEIVGFPAKFKNWRTIQNTDLEWIRVADAIDTNTNVKVAGVVQK